MSKAVIGGFAQELPEPRVNCACRRPRAAAQLSAQAPVARLAVSQASLLLASIRRGRFIGQSREGDAARSRLFGPFASDVAPRNHR